MAVETMITSYPQYQLEGGALPNCIGGDEDYRTVNNNTVEDTLFIRGWYGDNISDACYISKITVKNIKCKITNTSGGYATALVSGQIGRAISKVEGTISGTTIYKNTEKIITDIIWKDVERNSSTAITDMSGVLPENYGLLASRFLIGVRLYFKSSNNIRIYIKDVTLELTRTRACYITFKGDGVTETKTTYDYGSVPSYGSTPTRDGYTFKGWSNGTTTYSGTLPTAYEQDVTYTAVWEENSYTTPYTVNFNGNGETSGSVASISQNINTEFALPANGFEKRYTVTLNPNYSGSNVATAYSTATFQGWEDHGTIKSSSGEIFMAEQFDAPFYANHFADLYNAFKYNKQSLVDHYVQYGRNEGRVCTSSPRGTYPAGAVVNSLANEGGATTLYAQWSEMPAISLPTLTRDGYSFLGWYTAESGGTKVGGGEDSYTPSGNITLYAQWEAIAVAPEFISAAITYGGAQVSATNKVPAGEGFLIAVGIK